MIKVRLAKDNRRCINCKRSKGNELSKFNVLKEIVIGNKEAPIIVPLCESCLLELGREIWMKENAK